MKSSLCHIKELQPGDHLSFIYETEADYRAILTPFLREGLESGDKVIYTVDARSWETVMGYLQDDGVDTDTYMQSGQLVNLEVDAVYMREGVFNPEGTIQFLRSETGKALAEGYRALRASGEMSWALRGLPGSERLIEYETKLNGFFASNQCLAICQYDRRLFSPDLLFKVMTTHPTVVISNEIYDNGYYIPPRDVLGPDPYSARLTNLVRNLQERKHTEQALRESEKKYHTLFEESFDGLIFVSPAGEIIDINKKGVVMFGYDTKEEMLNLNLVKDILANPQDQKRIFSLINAQGSSEYETIVKKKNGTEMIALCSLTAEKDKEGRVVSYLAVIRDITAHKEAEEQRLAHLRLFENLDHINQAFQGADDLELMISNVLDALLSFFACDQVFLGHPHQCSYLRVWKPEEEKLFLTVGRRLTDAMTSLLIYHILRETERKNFCQSEQLRPVGVQLAEEGEMERQRLARELHDQVGQNLSTIGLNLNIMQAEIPQGQKNLLARLEDSLTLIEKTYDSIRTLLAELRPPVIDDYGLVEALRWYGSQFTQRTCIVVDVDGEEPIPRLPDKVEIALFRIVQEALNNVSKHAQASRVTISLEVDNDMVRLVITDNGIGFNTDCGIRFKSQQGWGLLIMNERALAIGGRCQIKSQHGEGTTVLVGISR